jgi:hypothetical protein
MSNKKSIDDEIDVPSEHVVWDTKYYCTINDRYYNEIPMYVAIQDWRTGELVHIKDNNKDKYFVSWPSYVALSTAGASKVSVKSNKRALPIDERCDIYKKFGKRHYLEIHRLIDNVGGELGRLIWRIWMMYEEKLKVENAHYRNKLPYSNSEKGMYIDIAADSKGRILDFLMPYQAFFHEAAHGIDRLSSYKIGDDGAPTPYSYIYADDTGRENVFGRTIIEEVRQKINHIERYIQNRSQLERESMDDDNDPYNVLKANLTSGVPEIYGAFLFDIIEGATDGRSSFEEYKIGHGMAYWRNKNYNLAKEAFANMFSVAITNERAWGWMGVELPQSKDIFIKILKRMAR